MTTFEIMAIILLVAVLGLVVLLYRKFSLPRKDDSQPMLLIQNQINEIVRTLDQRLQESSRQMHHQFTASAGIIKDVTEKLVKLDETNRQVVGFADQLKNLQDILKNPKQRGILGEYYLETLLKNVFPPGMYQMQYSFKDGVIVDAALLYHDQIIPIDSKFSLENYNRMLEARDAEERARFEKLFRQDLKNRIDETAKYVRPQERTTDFAFMFIPAEAIYYDLLVNKVGTTTEQNLIEYAWNNKKVLIASPSTFLAYLQTALQVMRREQVQKSTEEIIKRVQDLGRHLGAYEAYMQKLGERLGTTVTAYNSAYKELEKIDKDVLKIGGEAAGVEAALLEKPKQEEETLL